MGRYKISDLESLSGVKSHTIRIWEQRYNVLTPLRSETNIRYYDDNQLRKLLNVVSLIAAGNKISAISKLSEQELKDKIAALLNTDSVGVKEGLLISQMVSAGLAYDSDLFEKAFSTAILSLGLLATYQNVLYPMLNKIGLLWSISEMNPAQEHFVSNLLKQKIYAAIDALNPSKSNAEKWLLFLPEGEQHDLGLLIANYGLSLKGAKVFYLGANVPMSNISSVANEVGPTHYLTFSVKSNQQQLISDYFKKMGNELNSPSINICCTKDFAKDLKLSNNVNVISCFEEFKELLLK